MTEEELAEEYADRTKIVDENTNVGEDCISLIQDFEGNVMDIHQRIKTAFLAGYRAKTQWHNLRKNPYDLPEESRDFYCLLRSKMGGASFYGVCRYISEYKEWEDCADVIAWCEIPTFKE